METWMLLVISGVVPGLITVLGPHLSARLKARQAARKADADIGFDLRDELRAELGRRDERIAQLEKECGELRAWCTRLELTLRQRAPDAFDALLRERKA